MEGKKMHGSSTSTSVHKTMQPRGEEARMKKVSATVQSSGGLMKHNVMPKKGKGEF